MPAKSSSKAKEIGRRIALARKEAGGMRQRELAELLDVTERSIAAYESGEVIPYRFLPKLESALGRPAAWFLYGDDGAATRDAMQIAMERQQEHMDLVRQSLENQSLMLERLNKILEILTK